MKFKRLLQLSTISILFLLSGLLCADISILSADTDGIDRCRNLGLEDAAAILDVSVDDLQKTSLDLMISPDDLRKKIYKVHPYSCIIRSKSNFLKSINYVTYVYSDPKQAHMEFKKMQKSFEIVSRVDVLPDIGDETFWVDDNRFQRMVSIKSDVVIDVLSPMEFNLQKQVLLRVLANFTKE